MKQIALILALSFALFGCATTNGVPPTGASIVAQVQAITRQACGFVPLAQTVVAIISQGQFTQAFTVANAICAAVTQPPTVMVAARTSEGAVAARRPVPTVSGVPVRGTFVVRR